MKMFLMLLLTVFTFTANAVPRAHVDPRNMMGSLTTTQRNAINLKVTGMIVYNTTTASFERYNGTTWDAVGGGGSNTTLSNLTNTIAIPDAVVLLPVTSGGSQLGSTTKQIGSVISRQLLIYNSSGLEQYGVNGAIVIPDGATTSGIRVESATVPFTIMSQNQVGSAVSMGLKLQTGNTVNGNSADIGVRTGVPSGTGVRGKIVMEALSVKMPVGTADPAGAVAGDVYMNTSTNPGFLKVYNGTAWVTVGSQL